MKTVHTICLGAASVVALLSAQPALAQTAPKRAVIGQSLIPPAFSAARVEASMIEFPLPKGEEAYASIDGKKMHKYVVEQAEISRHFRDAGHPKFWGRITGFSSDTESQQWMMAKLKSFGVQDVHLQPFDLKPQWLANSWTVSVSAGGQTMELTSAQPAYQAKSTPPGGLELDAVYAGLGNEADFAGKDVKGKAVFVYGMQGLADAGAVRRAGQKGAAVVFDVSMLPGNMRYESYPAGTDASTFTLGNDDGAAARKLIESGPAKVRVTLDTEMVPNLKTALVFGTLPGATDETIYITAHRDGWFDGASDNAGGVASLLGLAEYYSKIPQAKRRRTIVFVGLDGHHNGSDGGVGRAWMAANKATLFPKTALFINIEHPSTIATESRPRYYPGDEIAWANTDMPMSWYGGGKSRPELEKLVWNTFKKFGVPLNQDASYVPPAGDAGRFYTFVPAVDVGQYHNYFHTDWETPEVVTWTGLQATTRAHAKLIDEVNKLPLSALQRPEEKPPARGGE